MWITMQCRKKCQSPWLQSQVEMPLISSQPQQILMGWELNFHDIQAWCLYFLLNLVLICRYIAFRLSALIEMLGTIQGQSHLSVILIVQERVERTASMALDLYLCPFFQAYKAEISQREISIHNVWDERGLELSEVYGLIIFPAECTRRTPQLELTLDPVKASLRPCIHHLAL